MLVTNSRKVTGWVGGDFLGGVVSSWWDACVRIHRIPSLKIPRLHSYKADSKAHYHAAFLLSRSRRMSEWFGP